jgi:predicted amidohydrolase YtcJ
MVSRSALSIVLLAATVLAGAQAPPADLILTNGRIVTVDDTFAIASAVAIRGERIAAVGATAAIEALAGPATRRIDLRGQTVIPGLIDNHMHLLRAGTTWQYEVRWDGIGSRREALDRLRARVEATPRGEWIYILGGWAIEQFADDPAPFTRVELDRVAPDHPVLLQASYYEAYLNSRAVETLGVEAPTGRVGESGIRALAGRLPTATGAALETSTRRMLADLNAMGLTAFGSAGCEGNVLPLYRRWADRSELHVRVFCITRSLESPSGDSYLDDVAYGESVVGALHDPMFLSRSSPSPADLLAWRRTAAEVAAAGRRPPVLRCARRPSRWSCRCRPDSPGRGCCRP